MVLNQIVFNAKSSCYNVVVVVLKTRPFQTAEADINFKRSHLINATVLGYPFMEHEDY